MSSPYILLKYYIRTISSAVVLSKLTSIYRFRFDSFVEIWHPLISTLHPLEYVSLKILRQFLFLFLSFQTHCIISFATGKKNINGITKWGGFKSVALKLSSCQLRVRNMRSTLHLSVYEKGCGGGRKFSFISRRD